MLRTAPSAPDRKIEKQATHAHTCNRICNFSRLPPPCPLAQSSSCSPWFERAGSANPLFFSCPPSAGHRRVVVTFCFEIKHTHNSFGLAVLTHNFNLLLVLDLTLHAALALLQLHLHLGLLAQQHRPMAHPAIEARIPGLEGHPPPEELDPPGDPPPKPMLNPTLPEDLLLRGQKGERGQKREGQRGDLRSSGRLTFSRWLSAQMTASQSHLSRQCGSNRAH